MTSTTTASSPAELPATRSVPTGMPPVSFAVDGVVTWAMSSGSLPRYAIGLASWPRIRMTATTSTATAAVSPPIASMRLRFSRRLASSRSLRASARAASRRSALLGRGEFVDMALPRSVVDRTQDTVSQAREPASSLRMTGQLPEPGLDLGPHRVRVEHERTVLVGTGPSFAVDQHRRGREPAEQLVTPRGRRVHPTREGPLGPRRGLGELPDDVLGDARGPCDLGEVGVARPLPLPGLVRHECLVERDEVRGGAVGHDRGGGRGTRRVLPRTLGPLVEEGHGPVHERDRARVREPRELRSHDRLEV